MIPSRGTWPESFSFSHDSNGRSRRQTRSCGVFAGRCLTTLTGNHLSLHQCWQRYLGRHSYTATSDLGDFSITRLQEVILASDDVHLGMCLSCAGVCSLTVCWVLYLKYLLYFTRFRSVLWFCSPTYPIPWFLAKVLHRTQVPYIRYSR